MNLVKLNPISADYTPVSFSSVLDRFFNDSLLRGGHATFVPQVDISESEQAFEISVAAPGMSKEDFSIECHNGELTIKGERKMSEEKKNKNYHAIESRYGSFSRTFALPESVQVENIKAAYNQGILEITLPKDEKKTKKHQISVN